MLLSYSVPTVKRVKSFISCLGHLKSSGSFYGYPGGAAYFPSGASHGDPPFLPGARSGCADAMRTASHLDCDSYMGPNYSSDHESTSDGEIDEN